MSYASWTVAGRLAAVVVLLACTPAQAQERLLLLRNGNLLVEVDATDVNLGALLRTLPLPSGTSGLRLAGGRFLALRRQVSYPGPNVVGILDSRSFSLLTTQTFQGQVYLQADEYRPRLFYRTPTEVGVMEPPTFEPRALRATPDIAEPPHGLCCGSFPYVHATNTLLISRGFTSTGFEYLGIDADTGAVRSVLPIQGQPAGWVVNDTDRKLYLPMTVSFSATEIRTYDLDTLALVAVTAPFPVSGLVWSFDPGRRQIVATSPYSHLQRPGPWTAVLDSSLTLLGSADLTYLRMSQTASLSFMPGSIRNRTLVTVSRPRYRGSSVPSELEGQAFLIALDATSLRPVVTIDLVQRFPGVETDSTQGILLQPPPPPAPLASSVTAHRVELTWRNPGDTTHFIVEAGTISGRSNIGMFHVGNVTTWAVENVPPGTYYVRVRAINDVGLSLPSNEVAVTVQ